MIDIGNVALDQILSNVGARGESVAVGVKNSAIDLVHDRFQSNLAAGAELGGGIAVLLQGGRTEGAGQLIQILVREGRHLGHPITGARIL